MIAGHLSTKKEQSYTFVLFLEKYPYLVGGLTRIVDGLTCRSQDCSKGHWSIPQKLTYLGKRGVTLCRRSDSDMKIKKK